MVTEWHGQSLNTCSELNLSNICVCVCVSLPGLVVVMAVVFVIVKVEPCICQSNRLENLMTISIVIHENLGAF